MDGPAEAAAVAAPPRTGGPAADRSPEPGGASGPATAGARLPVTGLRLAGADVLRATLSASGG